MKKPVFNCPELVPTLKPWPVTGEDFSKVFLLATKENSVHGKCFTDWHNTLDRYYPMVYTNGFSGLTVESWQALINSLFDYFDNLVKYYNSKAGKK